MARVSNLGVSDESSGSLPVADAQQVYTRAICFFYEPAYPNACDHTSTFRARAKRGYGLPGIPLMLCNSCTLRLREMGMLEWVQSRHGLRGGCSGHVTSLSPIRPIVIIPVDDQTDKPPNSFAWASSRSVD